MNTRAPGNIYVSRAASVRRVMARTGCTHALISDATDVRYLTGFCSSNIFALIGPKQHLLFTDFRYQTAITHYCASGRMWKPVIIAENDFSFLKTHVPARSVLGFQSSSVTVEQLDSLRKALRRVRLVKLGSATADIGTVKSPQEIAVMARCARIASRALRLTLAQLRLGMSEMQVRDILEDHCRRLGSQGPAFETIVLFGPRSALPHGTPSAARLKPGQFVLFDFGCTMHGLRSDMTRTVVMGRADRLQREIYSTVLSAQQTARDGVRGGQKTARIDRLAREIITRAGYGKEFGHATGHGVGYRIHEPPRLSEKSSATLAPGMIVTVEPGIYINQTGGVRIEDMVAVTPRGCRVLTTFPRHLMEL